MNEGARKNLFLQCVEVLSLYNGYRLDLIVEDEFAVKIKSIEKFAAL